MLKNEFGYYVMTSAEYDNWMEKYNTIMDDPNSPDALLVQMEEINDMIAIED